MGLENPKEAKAYLEKHFKKPLSEIDKNFNQDGKINVDRKRSIKVDHLETANVLLKLINVTPMHYMCKRIMTFKIQNPGIDNLRVAWTFGIQTSDVVKYEADGKKACMAYMKKTSLQEGVDKFNSEQIVSNAVKNLGVNGTLTKLNSAKKLTDQGAK